MKFLRLFAVFVLLLTFVLTPQTMQAQAGITYFISAVDAGEFPTVRFRVRVVGLDGRVVTGLTSANLAVYENGQLIPVQNVQVTAKDDGPLNLIFLIDQGRLSNYQAFGLTNVRQVFSRLIESGVFVDGRDRVQVMVRENINSDRTEVRLGVTQTGAELSAWVASYPFERRSANSTKGLEGVADALRAMEALVPVPGSEAAALIFLTRYIEDPAQSVAVTVAQNRANEARSRFIPIYAVQTDIAQTFKQPLEVLAAGSNGQFVPLQRATVAQSMDAVYQALNAQRLYYEVTYTSISGQSGARQITLNAPEAPSVGVVGRYEVTVSPPTVTLETPTAGSVVRRELLATATAENPAYGTPSVPVTARIAWGEGRPRLIRSAELLVNGRVQATRQVAPGVDTVEFDADISAITTAGRNPMTIEVRVTDSLGLEASGRVQIVVEVAPPPTPAPTPMPVPQFSVLEAVGIAGLCGAGLLVLAVVGAIAFFVLRQRAAPGAAPARPVPAEAQKTIVAGKALQATAIAMITVLEGPKGLLNEPIILVKPRSVLGRNPQVTDVTFYPDQESSVSRIHCTIEQRPDKTFTLTDNGSSSGTRLNGRQIRPDEPVPLSDGDEVVLGDLGRSGVKFRFNLIADRKAPAKFSGSADDRTIIAPIRSDDKFKER
ncbi:MAG: FHA domain-containing protein [Anaerolineales bacterium]|nr:FHA domain-containing protein [Anaerolineales bacterium]